MLLSIISSNVISFSAISSSAISMFIIPGLPQYWGKIIIGLVSLLSLKEVLSVSKQWNRHLNSSFNLAIMPLLFCLGAIVFFKVAEII